MTCHKGRSSKKMTKRNKKALKITGTKPGKSYRAKKKKRK